MEKVIVDLVIQGGAMGLLAFVVWYGIAKVLPARDKQYADTLLAITNKHELSLTKQRRQFLGALAKQRRSQRRIELRIEQNERNIGRNIERLTVMLIATAARETGATSMSDLPPEIQRIMTDLNDEHRTRHGPIGDDGSPRS
jgi:hypothetical protein